MIEDVKAIPKVVLLYASVEGFLRIPLIGSHPVPSVAAEPGASETGSTAAPSASPG